MGLGDPQGEVGEVVRPSWRDLMLLSGGEVLRKGSQAIFFWGEETKVTLLRCRRLFVGDDMLSSISEKLLLGGEVVFSIVERLFSVY